MCYIDCIGSVRPLILKLTMAKHVSCENHNDTCKCKGGIAAQSLDEMEFERGIWSAAQYGELERVKMLIENGRCKPDQKDSAGYTALHYAARNGHSDICKYLLEKGADINATTRSGQATALLRACSAVALLLSSKADVTKQDSDGKTALHRAAENKHKAICDILISRFPDIKDIPDLKGNLPPIY
ncbi:ankyrin repeat domain-containing protein 39-like isoform X2 [Anthonomus grandis grandis]|uniref:ankyrin repeat domain-containing protein 39-like isoform X2 n=1 Tax=Anthonomus grandis grandis TaxID=2921223 RepID=UPI0021655226|nr:ankyrin repeat domain-containing protein 39-like isoform X2 [Anthonomus grandis grandis]